MPKAGLWGKGAKVKAALAEVIEKTGMGYSCYVPDLPGCVAAGATVAKVKAALAVVLPFDLEGLREGGEPVPGAESVVEWVEV